MSERTIRPTELTPGDIGHHVTVTGAVVKDRTPYYSVGPNLSREVEIGGPLEGFNPVPRGGEGWVGKHSTTLDLNVGGVTVRVSTASRVVVR